MASRASSILLELSSYSKYNPGKPIKDKNNKEIPGTTALANNTSVHYDSDPNAGGHFIQRHGFNDSIERFQLTHENAKNLLHHLKKYVKLHDQDKPNPNKGHTSDKDSSST